jgi:hypothetical protein
MQSGDHKNMVTQFRLERNAYAPRGFSERQVLGEEPR